MQQRAFLQLTERGQGEATFDIWIDVDQVVAVRDCGELGSFVYTIGFELPTTVIESGAEVIDRLHRTAEAMAAQ